MIQENIEKIYMNNYFSKRSAYCNMVATSILQNNDNSIFRLTKNMKLKIFRGKCQNQLKSHHIRLL